MPDIPPPGSDDPTASYRPAEPPSETDTAPDRRADSAPPRSLDPQGDPLPDGTGRFRPVEFHKAGGMGRVHRAVDAELSRPVAFKDIQPEFADRDSARTRLVFEAEVTGRLEHPGVVPVYGLGRDTAGRPFYAMRFVEGESLRDAIRAFHAATGLAGADRALALRRLLTRFVSICQTVAFAHSRGVLHRDLKPDNVMLGPFGETLVVDWGLAKRVRAREGEAASVAEAWTGPTASTAGSKCGSPPYWSPEQADGRPDAHDERTDVFGLGAVLHELLTGRPPNDRGRPHPTPPGPRATARWVDLELDAVVRRALAFDPADRFPSAADVATAVEFWLGDQPIAAQRAAVRALADRAAAHPADTTLAEQLARQRANLGLMFSGMGRDAEAVAELGPAADAFGRLAAERRKLRLQADEANCRLALARALLALGRTDESTAANRAATMIYAGLIDARPGEYRANYADIMLTYTGLPPVPPRPEVPPAEQTIVLPQAPEQPADPHRTTVRAEGAGSPASVPPNEPSVELDRVADTDSGSFTSPRETVQRGSTAPTGLSPGDPNPTSIYSGESRLPVDEAAGKVDDSDESILEDWAEPEIDEPAAEAVDPNPTWPPADPSGTLPPADPNPTFPPLENSYRSKIQAELPEGFDLIRLLGEGGMGRVFLARDLALDRLVAIKTLPRSVASLNQQQYFRREMRLTARLEHPNVVRVYGSGTDARHGQSFMILEYLDGRSVLDLLREQGPGWTTALLDPIAQACDGLHYAHTRGIVHRDSKPSNIIVLSTGRAVVYDWGIAMPSGEYRREDLYEDFLDDFREPDIKGTPAYMSPEHCRGSGSITPAADIYILGAGLYQIISGRVPHNGESVMECMVIAVKGDFPRLRELRPDVPAELDAICTKAMALRPEDRYPTAAALGADIRAFLAGHTV